MKHTLRTLETDGVSWEAVLGMTTVHAKELWAAHRGGNAVPLLTDPDANQKLAKDQNGYLAWSLSLAPHRDGGTNVCPSSTKACRKHCVSYAGKGGITVVGNARILRTSFLMTQPVAFMRLLVDEIDRAVVKCDKLGTGMAMRLNAFSDVAWERVAPWMFDMFDMVRFYDYTKRVDRLGVPSWRGWTGAEVFERWVPDNYSLTLSRTEASSNSIITDAALDGVNVAVIFTTKRHADLPSHHLGIPVVDGDASDLRFKDPDGVIVGLRAKGTLRSDNSLGFAVTVTA